MHTDTSPPVRVGLTPVDDHGTRIELEARLDGFQGRVEVLRSPDPHEPDLLLVDPCVDGGPLDLTRLRDVGGDGRLVVWTSAPTVDELAFAMAGSVMDGRLRGLLSHDLGSAHLVDALERIHRGDIVVQGA